MPLHQYSHPKMVINIFHLFFWLFRLQIKEIFDLFDTDGSGRIDRKELQLAMVALGFHTRAQTNSKQISKKFLSSFNDVDSDDGELTLDEFKALMKGEMAGRHPMDELQDVFTVLSRSDSQAQYDGKITLDKLRRACREFRLRLNEDELATMMREADKDGDGVIFEEEFMRIMRMSAWF